MVTPNTNLSDQPSYLDATFTQLDYSNGTLADKTFDHCQFNQCHFMEATFDHCEFIECEFIDCNFSAARFQKTQYRDCIFESCKLIGINWTQLKWPSIKLNSSVQFHRCNLSQSSFYELALSEIRMETCVATDVDFRQADLSYGIFCDTDFSGSQFMHTNLHSANFSGAINYLINPTENTISKATFSLPDAINLLRGFDITIEP